jgi:hypothetical protein
MTNTSFTLQETGIAPAIDDGETYESARNTMMALDFATQLQETKGIAGQPEVALGGVHAITRDGALVIASASGSQLASYASGANNVDFATRTSASTGNGSNSTSSGSPGSSRSTSTPPGCTRTS